MGETRKSRRKVSRPIMVAPEKLGANCAFKGACCRKCMTPQRPIIIKKTKKLVKKKIKGLLKRINSLTKLPFSPEKIDVKHEAIRDLLFLLEGVAIPRRNGDVEYALCGESDDDGMQVMQMLSPKELKEILGKVSLSINPIGGFMQVSESAPPSGMRLALARLLAQISAVELPEKRDALTMLSMEGGMEGITAISIMASEPTVMGETRGEYLRALKWIISCAEFSAGKNAEISKEDYGLAAALSRFFPVEALGGKDELDTVHFYDLDKLPPIPSEAFEPRLKQMVTFAMSEFFRALVDMSARINSIFESSPEQIENYSKLGEEYYASLELGVRLLVGKGMKNKAIFEEVCGRKKEEFGPYTELDQKELAMLKHVVRKFTEEEKLDHSAAANLFSVLGNEEVNLQEQLVRISFHPEPILEAE
ncbi:MAG: hypothetical protein GY852_03585 [bacterium]|nr:hypothetical protein [bacterium]